MGSIALLVGPPALAGAIVIAVAQPVASPPAPLQAELGAHQHPLGAASAPTLPAGNPELGRAGTREWRLRKPATAGQIEGYTTRVSGLPGATVGLRVSTPARSFRVRAFRFGWYRGGAARLVWASDPVRGGRQPHRVLAPFRTRTVVAPWHVSLWVPTTGWAPGAYLFKLVAADGWEAYTPYVVRSPSTVGRLALVAPVTTWQAYDDWGGYSLYTGPAGDRRSWAVSFDRPYPAPGAGEFLFSVRSVVSRAERLGIPLAYLTNVDLDAEPGILRGAAGYVSMGHDEYWTPAMRRAVTAARDTGTNLAFLGANTMYWRIRLGARPTGPRRLVVGYRSDAVVDPVRHQHPAETTARYRDPPAASSENRLTGMLYECFPVDAPYRVVSPGWWGFRGTGVGPGSTFAHLVGVEADRVYPIRSTPRPLQVLSSAGYDCGGVRTSTQSVYYTAPSGAAVFNAGTLRWTCALLGHCAPYAMPARTVRFVSVVTDNVFRRFAAGPVGRLSPAKDNVGRFRLPTVDRVPASRTAGPLVASTH
jgi:hypothetical protein